MEIPSSADFHYYQYHYNRPPGLCKGHFQNFIVIFPEKAASPPCDGFLHKKKCVFFTEISAT